MIASSYLNEIAALGKINENSAVLFAWLSLLR
jgi:hypothetical protein